MPSNLANEWWHDFFVDFRPVFDETPAKNTNALVRYIISELRLKRGSTFLDCPCGIGRVAIPLAAKGIKVTGVDITPSYIEEFRLRAKRRGLSVRAILEDMRRIDFREEFEAAGNIWTSFGYFEKESDNLLVLRKYFRALKPGGRFIVTLINRDWVIANFQNRNWDQVKDVKVLENQTFDYSRSASITDWHFIKGGRETVHKTYIRMYSLHELLEMMRSVGFTDLKGYGSIKNEEVSLSLRMMIVNGTKPSTKK